MDRKYADPSAEELAESLMPGWKALRSGTSGRSESGYKDKLEDLGVDVVTMPSLETLKARYAGFASSRPAAPVKPDSLSRTDDTAIVNLQNGPLTKTVAVSKSEKRVLWSQG